MARTRTAAALALVGAEPPALTALPAPHDGTVTASARPLPPNKTFTPQYSEVQVSAWDMWEGVGEAYAGVRWLSNALSRVRLVIATTTDDGTAPVRVEDGPAVDILNRLAGGAGGQSQMMGEFGIHYSTPGECWLVGEQPDPTSEYGPTRERWCVLSADELRIAESARARKQYGARTTYEIREFEGTTGQANRPGTPPVWRPISPESLVVRCWRQHPRYGWRADSPMIHALPALVELDLINKRIMAEIMSRLASNGILLYDAKRLSIPGRVPGQGADVNAPDAFGTMLVDVASNGIANPASPEACLPIPIGHNIDDLTDIDPKNLLQLVEFPSEINDKLLELRKAAISRVATALDIPDEWLNQDRGDVNHWGLSQISEDAIQGPISSTAELICNSLTVGFLEPMLLAEGLDPVGTDGTRLIIWYDPSELEVKSDNTDDVVKAYDRGEVTGETLRRRIGETEDSAPDDEQLTHMVLLQQALAGSTDALKALLSGDVSALTSTPAAGVRFDENGNPIEDPAGGADIEPAAQIVLDMVAKAPSLVSVVTLTDLRDQVEALLDGSDAPPPKSPPPGAAPASTPPADAPGADGTAPPTRGDDAPSELTAAAAKTVTISWRGRD